MDSISTTTTVASVGNSSYTPRMAADEFVRTYWAQPRKIAKHWLVEGIQLACEFTIQGGTSIYRAAWLDDNRGHNSGHYMITRNTIADAQGGAA